MRLALVCLAAAVAVIAAVWTWLGQPIPMPSAPLKAGDKLWCVSYAPFRGSQSPHQEGIQIPAAQIEEDIAQLAKMSNCLRVYATDQGIENVVPIAARYGMKVLQGAWVSNNPVKTQVQVEAALALAERYPDTVLAIVVGNEALLRGDISAGDLAALIRSVKARAKVPVTYADVWEFWLRAPDVAAAVDFVMIHILPYWEDFPIAAGQAAAHVNDIHKKMAGLYAPKNVYIGEMGWPSQGRMREGALPSPANQARVIQEVLAYAARENYRVNVIEAYDAPWKRAQEGVVGGHWGLFDDSHRAMKFGWGEPVSNHPFWKMQAAGGIAYAILVFGIALWARRHSFLPAAPARLWLAVTANALVGGITIGWTVVNVPIESMGVGGWIRCLALATAAIASPLVLSAAIMRGIPQPAIARIIGPKSGRAQHKTAIAVGCVAMLTILVAVISALGLVFDPRYKDFPFAPLTGAAMPFLVASLVTPRPSGGRAVTEFATALVLAASVVWIVPNETVANGQSLWMCAALAAFAISLVRVRDAQS
ncbi:beta-(1-6) glucans synthase [Undibacter mobilis]|uniref:Endo-1,3-beta-glucanase btgC n=1 Tax=Undibacter mobilis TaxID=2292256 RepID=A0A371B0S6_9BRAD|nr:beta-(1-6) glucans synthase [Undibacter mobilis]RDV01140.1 beta-(1-6) glucans synthase [Undibacter mobilis]